MQIGNIVKLKNNKLFISPTVCKCLKIMSHKLCIGSVVVSIYVESFYLVWQSCAKYIIFESHLLYVLLTSPYTLTIVFWLVSVPS